MAESEISLTASWPSALDPLRSTSMVLTLTNNTTVPLTASVTWEMLLVRNGIIEAILTDPLLALARPTLLPGVPTTVVAEVFSRSACDAAPALAPGNYGAVLLVQLAQPNDSGAVVFSTTPRAVSIGAN